MATRTVFMDEWLLAIAKDAHGRAARDPQDGNSAVVALTFAAFAVEACLNHSGASVSSSWDKYEMLTTKMKIYLLHDLAQVTQPDLGQRPWQSFTELFDVRNDIAHAKHRPGIPTVPLTSWEKAADRARLAQLISNAEAIIRALHTTFVPGHAVGETMAIQASETGSGADTAVLDKRDDTQGPTGPVGP